MAADYTGLMRLIRNFFSLLVLLLITATVHADDPVLMLLEHTEKGQPVQTKVPAKAGEAVSPLSGKALEKIRVLPGNPLSLEQRPADVTVELRRGSGIGASAVCAITVRYFRNARGLWVPHFKLIEEVLVTRDPSGRWRPISLARGMPSLMVMIGTSLPNTEGFYAMLELGLTNGTLQIDSWTMR